MNDPRLDRETDDLAVSVGQGAEPTTFHKGTVSSVTGSLVSYTDSRGNTIPDVTCFGALPAAGDVVVVLQRTPLRVVLGPDVADGGSGDPTMGGDLSGLASAAQLVAGAVDTPELAAGAVTAANVAADVATQAELDTHAGAADPHTGYVRESLVDQPGDLFVGTAADTVARKAVGADGTILVAESAQSDDLVWRAPALSKASASSGLTVTTVTTATDIPGASVAITLARANQPVSVEATFDCDVGASGTGIVIGVLDVDGTDEAPEAHFSSASAARATVGQGWQLTTLGSGAHTLKLQGYKTSSGGGATAIQGTHTGLRVVVWP